MFDSLSPYTIKGRVISVEKKDTLSKYLYFGFDRDTLTVQRENIDRGNLRVLKSLCAIFYFASAVEALVLSFLEPGNNHRMFMLLIIAAVSLFIYFLSKRAVTAKKLQRPHSVDILIFFTSLFYYLATAALGTFLFPGSLAVKLPLMFAVIQIVFIISPLQNLITVGISAVAFLHFSRITKNSDLAAFDALNAVISLSFGLVVSWSSSRIKIENLESAEKLRRSNYALYHETITDALTGLSNRKMSMNTLSQLCLEEYAADDYITCIVIDVDHFKEYNRFYGRPAGDSILKTIGKLLSDYCQEHGIALGRIGGEEFMLVFKGASSETSETAAEELRLAVKALNIPNNASRVSDTITVTLGIFSARLEDFNVPDEIYATADRALYKAKEDGKDRAWKYLPDINGFTLLKPDSAL